MNEVFLSPGQCVALFIFALVGLYMLVLHVVLR